MSICDPHLSRPLPSKAICVLGHICASNHRLDLTGQTASRSSTEQVERAQSQILVVNATKLKNKKQMLFYLLKAY